jgi:hypothetical protein
MPPTVCKFPAATGEYKWPPPSVNQLASFTGTLMKSIRVFALAIVSTLALSACTSNPLMNLNDRPIPSRYDGQPQTMDSVTKSIIAGCMEKGWACQQTAPGVIDASITVRKHRAMAEINFNVRRYSIVYKDSYLLDYNSRRNTIHRNYNRWINNLDHAIHTQLVM